MGSSSSKQYRYPYPSTSPSVQGVYPNMYSQPKPQRQGTFGYYMQQVGDDPNQVRAIPGYYYQPDEKRSRRHKRHNSAPMPSTAPSSQPHRSNTAAPIASSSQAQTSTSEAPPPAPNNPAAAAAPDQPADSQVKTEPTIQPTATQSAEAQQAAAAQQEAAVQQEAAAQQAAAPKPAATQSTGTQPTVTQPAPIAPAATKPARPAVKNPLPSLPKDVLETERYRHLRRTDANGSNKWRYAAPVASAAYKPQLRSQYQPAGKEPTLRLPRPPAEIVPKEKVIPDNKIWIPKEKRAVSKNKQPKAKSSGPFGLLRAFARPSLSRKKLNRYSSSPAMDYQYRYGASVPRAPIPQFPPVLLDPPKLSGVPVTVYRNSNLNPTSPHRVLYKKKPYPTAAHLFEALKYLKHRPDLAEQIRMATDSATEIGTLSMSFQMEGLVRPDWQSVWKDKIDEVLYLKFSQHSDIYTELMATGNAPIVDANDITPGAPDDDGVNELGKALVRVRERFRRDSIAPAITVPLTSPLNPVSPHKILYKKKLYPTAAHLFEAHKFLKHRPDLAERIRTASDNAAEMGALAWSFQLDGQVRPDWELVWRDKMDEVLYLKFVQHPDLRADLMATGYSPLLDGNDAMAGRPDGEGVNELGKALFRLRERLRREGAR